MFVHILGPSNRNRELMTNKSCISNSIPIISNASLRNFVSISYLILVCYVISKLTTLSAILQIKSFVKDNLIGSKLRILAQLWLVDSQCDRSDEWHIIA